MPNNVSMMIPPGKNAGIWGLWDYSRIPLP
jgi:hypothetical protein